MVDCCSLNMIRVRWSADTLWGACARLQAALALANVVIQTGVTGGTRHAARSCVNSGKPLFVVKYSD